MKIKINNFYKSLCIYYIIIIGKQDVGNILCFKRNIEISFVKFLGEPVINYICYKIDRYNSIF